MSAYDSLGAFSSFITLTIGSVSSDRTPITPIVLWCSRTEQPGSSRSLSTNVAIET